MEMDTDVAMVVSVPIGVKIKHLPGMVKFFQGVVFYFFHGIYKISKSYQM